MVVSFFLNGIVDWFVDGAVKMWQVAASFALSSGGMGDAEWQISFTIVNKLAGIMGFIAVGLGFIGLIQAMIRGRLGDTIGVFFKVLVAWPLTVTLVTLVVWLEGVITDVTARILSWGFGEDKIEVPGIQANQIGESLPGGVVMALFLAILMIIGSLVLALMMAARTFLLILGVGFAPVPMMSLGWSKMRAGLSHWGSWITGVLLFKPVCAIIIAITGKMMEAASESNFLFAYLSAIVGMVLASVFPWTLVKVVAQFLPGETGLRTASEGGKATVEKAKEAGEKVAGAAITIGTMGMAAGAGMAGAGGAVGKAGAGTSGSSGLGGKMKNFFTGSSSSQKDGHSSGDTARKVADVARAGASASSNPTTSRMLNAVGHMADLKAQNGQASAPASKDSSSTSSTSDSPSEEKSSTASRPPASTGESPISPTGVVSHGGLSVPSSEKTPEVNITVEPADPTVIVTGEDKVT